MKKFFIFIFTIGTALYATAQTTDNTVSDTTLKEYTGTYKFPEGSFVTSADMSINNGKLYVSSAQGSSPLEKKARDTFAFTNYNGMAYFIRNSAGNVARIKIEVEDILLEGVKEGVTAWLQRNPLFIKRRTVVVK